MYNCGGLRLCYVDWCNCLCFSWFLENAALVQRLGHNEKSQTPGIAIRGALTYSPSQFPGVHSRLYALGASPCRDTLIQPLSHKLCCVEAECHFYYLRDSSVYVHESCCPGDLRHLPTYVGPGRLPDGPPTKYGS